jgi:glycosyltransferase involved in cell wall biosynthesis
MESLSATLITYNEEANIEAALQSLAWVDEIVVVDSGSTDRTLEICRRHTDKVSTRTWTGYVDQKNHAVALASQDWILALDADERIGPELQREIEQLRRTRFQHAGYRIPRVAFFMGRWIRHGDWYPDHQLRLYDRRRGRWQGGQVHESVQVEGSVGILQNEILHYTYRSLSDYLKRLEVYSTLAARDYQQKQRAASMLKVLGNPIAAFVKGYLLKGGFLDGSPGLMVAIMGAISVFFKYAKLHELQKKDTVSER